MRAGTGSFLTAACLSASLAGCGGSGPVFPVDDALYDWVAAPQTVDLASDQPPEVGETVVAFRLAPGDRRSALRVGEDWRLGQTLLFGFDVRLVPGEPGRGPVDISRLVRNGAAPGAPQTEIVSVQLDPAHGVTVMGRRCIAPKDLTEWHRIEMRIRLSNGDHGYLEVFCDRRPIWARTGMRTTFPPECRLSEGCDAGVPRPARFEWQMGLLPDSAVSEPVQIQMQRLHHRLLIYTPNRAGTL